MGNTFTEALDSIGLGNLNGNRSADSYGEQEEIFLGEADYGVAASSEDDIPTRVKTPEKPSRKRTPPRSTAKLELRIAAIKEGLEDQVNDAAVIAGQRGFVTAGYVALEGSEDFVNAVVEMARNKPRVLAALEKASKGANVTKGLKYLLAIVMAVMVDLELRSPTEFGMQYLGVTEAYAATHPVETQQPVPAYERNFEPPPQFG